MQKKYNRYTLYDVPLFPSHQTGAPTYKLTHNLLAIFVGLDMLLLGIGITLIALSLVWMSAGLIQSMVLTREDLLAVLVLGGLFVATFLLSLPALLYTSSLSPVEEFSSTKLVVLNMTLCLDQVVVVLVGVIIWWRTLQERATFFQYWKNEDEDFRQSLEAKFDCCGYFTPCQSTANSSALPVCVDPITAYADKIMNILFTSIFATSAVVLLFLMCSGCIIAEFRVFNRYRKIDIKRGTLSVA